MVQRSRPSPLPSAPALVLAVGTERLGVWPTEGLRRLSLAQARILHVSWAHMSVTIVQRHTPQAVLCPLLGAGFDAVDMAERLAEARYRGLLLVVPEIALPDPRLIRQELGRAAARRFGVEVLQPA